MDNKPTTAEIIIMASGAVMLLFSFFNWFESSFGGGGISAWNGDAFPLFTYVPLIGIIAAGTLAAKRFAGTKLPAVMGLTWQQIYLVLGVFAVLLTVGILLTFGGEGVDTGIGLYLCLLGSIGLVVGAVMMNKEPESAAPGSGPATPF